MDDDQMQQTVRQPIRDAELNEDLRAIEVEIARRKKARPFEPYAVWAATERFAAFERFERRWAS